MNGTVVGVLRGGPSVEHDVSLATGKTIIANLSPEQFTVRDIYINKDGVWHERGRIVTPADTLRTLDVAVIGLQGGYGDDGEAQKLLERAGVPYTGSDPLGSFTAMHKLLSKERARELGIRTPDYRYIESLETMDPILHEVVRTFMQPVIVKPVRWGSSIGISLVSGFTALHNAVAELLKSGAEGVLIEEYIRGREASVGLVENIRGESLYALPPLETLVPPGAGFYTYEAKYSPDTVEECPSHFPKKVQDELIATARKMHEALGLRHYSRSDFIVTPRGIYYLETNSLPAIEEDSSYVRALNAVGISLPDFLSHLIGLALT